MTAGPYLFAGAKILTQGVWCPCPEACRLRGEGSDAIAGGNDAFTFIDGNAFGNHAGELRAVLIGGGLWSVSGNTDGDGAADFQVAVVVTDSHPLTGADFTF